MNQYLELTRKILEEGEESSDRTGTGTIALFGEQMKFDVRKGFPIVTTKFVPFKSGIAEMLWMLKGSTNLYDFRALVHGEEFRYDDSKKTFWDDNYYNQAISLGYEDGNMGEIYGGQWRSFDRGCYEDIAKNGTLYRDLSGIDQIKEIISEAKVNPSSRRLLLSSWNPRAVYESQDGYSVDKACLPPCHYVFQLNIVNGFIDLKYTMRSNDHFLGSPLNLVFYSSLLHVFGRILGKVPRHLTASLGNVHIYKNHIDQCKEQLSRTPYDLPSIWINPDLKTLEDFEHAVPEDFKLIGYENHPKIYGKMAI